MTQDNLSIIAVIPDKYNGSRVKAGYNFFSKAVELRFEDKQGNVQGPAFQLDEEGCEVLETTLRVARQKLRAATKK